MQKQDEQPQDKQPQDEPPQDKQPQDNTFLKEESNNFDIAHLDIQLSRIKYCHINESRLAVHGNGRYVSENDSNESCGTVYGGSAGRVHDKLKISFDDSLEKKSSGIRPAFHGSLYPSYGSIEYDNANNNEVPEPNKANEKQDNNLPTEKSNPFNCSLSIIGLADIYNVSDIYDNPELYLKVELDKIDKIYRDASESINQFQNIQYSSPVLNHKDIQLEFDGNPATSQKIENSQNIKYSSPVLNHNSIQLEFDGNPSNIANSQTIKDSSSNMQNVKKNNPPTGKKKCCTIF
jgi:hypothetical protein